MRSRRRSQPSRHKSRHDVTFAEILSDTYARLLYSTSPPADVVTRIKGYVNESQQDILGRDGFSRLLHGTITFASVVGQAEYALPPSVARVLAMVDTVNMITLNQVSEQYYRQILPDPTQISSTPTAFALLGLGTVAMPPSAASQLWVASSSASDTTQSLFYEVITASGYTRTGSVVLTGTTAVTLSSAITDAVQITDLYLSAACVGVVTVYQDVLKTLPLSAIGIGDLRSYFQRIALVNTPSAILTYTLQYERDIVPLVNNTDAPVLPLRFHRALGTGARYREYEFKNDEPRRLMAKKEYDETIGQINAYVVNGQSQIYIPNRPQRAPSVLGAWFPSSPW